MTDADGRDGLKAEDNIFIITEFCNAILEIVAYDCEAYIHGEYFGIYQHDTGQQCTQRFIALQDEHKIEFDKIVRRRELVRD